MHESSSKLDGSQLGRALSVLSKIAQTLTAIENPANILEQIAKEARDILDADIVDLYEYDQARNQFTVPPILVGDRLHPFVPKYQIYKDDVVFKVVKTGSTQYFPDAQHAEPLTGKFEVLRSGTPNDRFVIREKVLSSVSIPLQAATETVGVMFVNYRTIQEFDNEQKALIEWFSKLAAIAIYNSRLWNLQNNQLTSFKEIIDVIGAENPIPAILKQAVYLFAANHGSISRLMEDGQTLQFQARWENGDVDDENNDVSTRTINQGITGHVVQSSLPFRTGNVQECNFYEEIYPSTISEMAIPLRNAFEGITGVLNLESDFPDFFTEEHEKLCVSFAKAASAAIQQSDLIENIQSLHTLTEGYNLNDLLEQILKNLIRMMGANTAASVNLYDKEKDNFYSYYGVGPSWEFEEKYLLIPPREHGTGRFVLATKAPIYYEDVSHPPEAYPPVRSEAWDREIRSFAVLPLLYHGEVLGTLFIHKIGERIKFSEDARRILETYATQTAIAIYNTRHRVEVEPIRDMLNASVSRNPQDILKIIVEKAVHIMASDYASIWLGEEGTGDLVRAALYVRPDEERFVNPGVARIRHNQPSINTTVYRIGEPMVVGDVSEMENVGMYNRIYQKAKSEISVPLIYQGETIGTLNTESQKLGAFSDVDMTTFQVFADAATSVIKITQTLDKLSRTNQELEKRSAQLEANSQALGKRNEELDAVNFRLKRRNKSFEVLAQISQELTANVHCGEQEILQIIHNQASQIMDADNMYIALYDPQQDLVSFGLAFMDGTQVNIQKEKGWEPRSAGRGRTEWIIRNNAPILIYTKEDSENWYQQVDVQDYIKETFASWLGVPITYGEDVIGVIATYHRTKEYRFDPDDLKVLALMGRQAAIAMQNARLISQLGERIEELDKIRELGEELSRVIQ